MNEKGYASQKKLSGFPIMLIHVFKPTRSTAERTVLEDPPEQETGKQHKNNDPN